MSRTGNRHACAWSAAVLLGASAINAKAADYLSHVKPAFAQYCYRCHGASQQKNGLRMDTAESIKKGGQSGPGFVAGKSSESLIVQVLRGVHGTISQMPYKKPPLSEEQIAAVAEWIDAGGAGPADEAPHSEVHWAFVPPKRGELPELKDESRARNAIDRFVQARLEKDGIAPAPDADRTTLLRRLSLDLTGLPPAPEEVEAFLNDSRPDAYERQADRLLASAHYGERWGRWWLDVARYADSNGYSIDAPRQIWKYRDWVVNAFNSDMPFDQFAVDQLAGDLIPNATIEQKVATGFNRNTQVNQEGGIDPEQFRIESVMDRVNTFGTAFLGLTVACAQCHDHKFDPISQREYYKLFAFFNNTEEDGHGKNAPTGMLELPGEFEDMEAVQNELREAREELGRFLDAKGGEVTKWEQGLTGAEYATPWAERTLEQKRDAYAAYKKDDGAFKSRAARVDRLAKREPKPVTTLVMRELEKPRATHLLIKGDFTRPGEKVAPGVLESLHKPHGELQNRYDLARWTVDERNPLLARVVVNRIWQQYFGRGLVETENDFGTQGTPPTHPELLDWLAWELMRPTNSDARPWSLKQMHRLIVTSTTYRQSSKVRPELAQIDANNRLLARQSRLRLDAEIVRDVSLAVSGLLAPELGGPPVFPPQPDGVMSLGQSNRPWKASQGSQRHRRALYTHFWRATPHPALVVFDAPDGFSSCTRRIRSNTPLQALTLLNDQQFYEIARAFSEKIGSWRGDVREKIHRAFRLCLGRAPSEKEAARLLQLVEAESSEAAEHEREETSPPGAERWLTVARVLLNLDETITRE